VRCSQVTTFGVTRHTAPADAGTSTVVATRRDRYARIWAPVTINGQGPFNLVVDTGANGSAVTSKVAASLSLGRNHGPPMIVHGATGSTKVLSVPVESIFMGGMRIPGTALPIISDPLGIADGFLGISGLGNQRVVIDLLRDQISISTSPSTMRLDSEVVTLLADVTRIGLMAIEVHVARTSVTAVIVTAAPETMGNLAMRRALNGASTSGGPRHRAVGTGRKEAPHGDTRSLPPIELGSLRIIGVRASYGDMPIFTHLHLSSVPAMLIGMDVLGQFESLVLDYGNKTIQFRSRTSRHR
jgi:predicted aspartyl protease